MDKYISCPWKLGLYFGQIKTQISHSTHLTSNQISLKSIYEANIQEIQNKLCFCLKFCEQGLPFTKAALS